MRVACCAVIGRSVAWASPRRARHRGRAGPPRPDGTGQRAGLLAQRGAHHRQRGSLRGSGARAIAPRPGPCRQGWPPLIILNGRGLLFPRYRDCGSREDGGHEPQAPPVETTPRLNVINPDVELHAGPCRVLVQVDRHHDLTRQPTDSQHRLLPPTRAPQSTGNACRHAQLVLPLTLFRRGQGPASARTCTRQKSASGVARHRLGERETIGSVATRALTKDSVEMEFLTDDPVAQAVTCQRVTFDARAPRCGRYGCATAGRVS